MCLICVAFNETRGAKKESPGGLFFYSNSNSMASTPKPLTQICCSHHQHLQQDISPRKPALFWVSITVKMFGTTKCKYKYKNNVLPDKYLVIFQTQIQIQQQFLPDICLAIFQIQIQKQYSTRQIPGHLSPSLQLHHGRAQANWQVKKIQIQLDYIGWESFFWNAGWLRKQWLLFKLQNIFKL